VESLWVILGIVAVVVLVGGGLFLHFYLKAKRREAFGAFAMRHGLEYSAHDQFGLLGWPFSLFKRGHGRGIENVLWGNWQSQPIQAFDYWYYTETTDSEGNTSRSYSHFSCVLVEIAASFPHLEIAREGLFTRLADYVGLEDIEFESPEFNRRYNVKAQDRKFAYELLDGNAGVVGEFRPGAGLRGCGQPHPRLPRPSQASRPGAGDRDGHHVP
jgi:hypothetical protein